MYRVNISLASCFGNQFACGDGSCQPLNNQCDQKKDCSDGSDELDCNILQIDPITYVKDFLPPPVGDDLKLKILMSISIYRIVKLTETDSIASIQFRMHLTWRDARLNFNHLRDDTDRNILTEEEKLTIWTPEVVFHNTKDRFLSLNNVKTTILVKKQSDFQISPTSQTWKRKLYLGSENDLIYSHTYSTDFQCEFQLSNYPFDTQECYMIFNLPARMENLLEFELTDIDYQGPEQLTKYIVHDYFIVNTTDVKPSDLPEGAARSSKMIKLILKRRFTYQIITVYIPTLCLMVIIHTGLYYPKAYFEGSVMVGLTGMLTMTTLSLSISNNLPPTNYIKLIDVWMLFGMIMPFIDIILHTVIGYCHEKIESVELVLLIYDQDMFIVLLIIFLCFRRLKSRQGKALLLRVGLPGQGIRLSWPSTKGSFGSVT